MLNTQTNPLFLFLPFLILSLLFLDSSNARNPHQPDSYSDSLEDDSRAALYREKRKVLKQQGLHLLLEFSPACQKTKQERNAKKGERKREKCSICLWC